MRLPRCSPGQFATGPPRGIIPAVTRKKIGLTAFFVYGTLKPEGLYWPHVAALVAYWEPGQVQGKLYDTGLGYPAAIFGEDGTIDGILLFVIDAKVAQITAIMDEIEEEGRAYRRVEVATLDGQEAVAYEWMLGTEMLTPIEQF